METIIRLRLSELTESTLDKIKKLLSASTDNQDPQINISVETADYNSQLDKSISQIKSGNTLSFTMEDLETYVTKNFKD